VKFKNQKHYGTLNLEMIPFEKGILVDLHRVTVSMATLYDSRKYNNRLLYLLSDCRQRRNLDRDERDAKKNKEIQRINDTW
jgi:hypothetical protein